MDNLEELKKLFPVDSWIMWEWNGEKRFSEVFIGWEGTYEPFTQLNNFNPADYTIVTWKYVKSITEGAN